LLGAVLAAGCSPSGPKALLQGDELIQQGKFGLAIEKLKLATAALPRNAQAWNHLGLACHGAHQFEAARLAYQRALSLDRNLAATHFNLGCLFLEINDPVSALPELTSYTLLQPNVAQGWLKLGLAHLRLRQPALAVVPLNNALKLQPDIAEAWNALGTISIQKNRYAEALNHFTEALKYQPNYAPALLNQAVVLHQYTKNHALALQKYRQYAALNPPPPNLEEVQALAAKLELELTPASLRPVPRNVGAANSPLVATNLAAQVLTKPAPTVAPPPVVKAVEPTPAVAPTNAVTASELVLTPRKTPAPPTNAPSELPRKAPGRLVLTPRPSVTNAIPARVEAPKVEKAKPATVEPVAPPPKEVAELKPEPQKAKPVEVAVASEAPANPPAASSPAAVKPAIKPGGYPYRAPAAPATGNRGQASEIFREGAQWQKDGRWDEAVAAYRRATQVDPSYFDARYNLGLASQAAGLLPQALLEYEYALAIEPDSFEARFNFGLALQKANYPRDAATEWERASAARPGDWRTHLLLGNLYARALRQKTMAQPHYRKVLELDPQNSQAPAIRAWLAENP